MIYKETKLRCADNSGVNILKCVSVYGGIGRFCAGLGQFIKVVIKNFRKKKKVLRSIKGKSKELKRRVLYLGLVVAVKRKVARRDGVYFKADKNKVVLMSPTYSVFGSKIYGFVTKELGVLQQKDKAQKVLLLAKYIL